MWWIATTATSVDAVKLNFNPASLFLLNVILGLVMFGIALDLRIDDFKRVFRMPKAIIAGLTTQLLLLPAFTYLLTLILKPQPSIALGMILVAACPGGNISNFITHLSKGNTSLSVSMTAFCNVFALFTTPFHIAFWGGIHPTAKTIMKSVSLDPWGMLGIMLTLMILPLIAGMSVAAFKPTWAERLRGPFKIFSIVAFVTFIVVAMQKNFDFFWDYISVVFFLVAIHNAMAFLLGYTTGLVAGLKGRDRRALSVEVGIQNSGLGLILIFNFFNGLGGMAIVAAWWGVWHIIVGLTLASFWSQIPTGDEASLATE